MAGSRALLALQGAQRCGNLNRNASRVRDCYAPFAMTNRNDKKVGSARVLQLFTPSSCQIGRLGTIEPVRYE
jgi:hypothetical protein